MMSPKERAHDAICKAYNVINITGSRVEKELERAIATAERDILELAVAYYKDNGPAQDSIWLNNLKKWAKNPDGLREGK